MTAITGAPARPTPVAPVRRAARQHLGVGAAQLAAGLGNLAFVLLAARVLAPAAFAAVAAFVALHTLVHLPGFALGAGAAVDPWRTRRVIRLSLVVTLPLASALVLQSGPVSTFIGLPSGMVIALAIALPGAPVQGVLRGAAYGWRSYRVVAGSLLLEPALRLGVGAVLAVIAGPVAAAFGVVCASYAATLFLLRSDAGPEAAANAPDTRVVTAGWATVAFFAFVALQQQDLIIANRILDPSGAATFAVVSTIGGAVAFATATLPFVVLPSGDHGRERARIALTAAGVLAAGAVLAALVVGPELLRVVAGHPLPAAHALLAPYLGAMGLLGIARVVAANRLRTGPRVTVTGLGIALFALLHTGALLLFGHSVGAVVVITTLAMAALVTQLAVPNVLELRPVAGRVALLNERQPRRVAIGLGVLVALGLVVRLISSRGLWVDEAISVTQVQQPLGTMLQSLQQTDVHPPLHYLLLWVTVRVAGTSELAVRLPSIIAGTLVIPAVYGLARELYDRRTGFVAAILAVPAPFMVWYSQESRMYALFMLLAVLSVWSQVAAVRYGRWTAWFTWSLTTAAFLATQWFAIVPIVVEQVAFLVVLWRRRRARGEMWAFVRRWSAALLAFVVLVLPLLPILLGELASYHARGSMTAALPSTAGGDVASAGAGLSVYSIGANLIWAVTGYHADTTMEQIAALWPLLMLGALALLGRRWRGETKFLVALIAVPLAVLFVLGSVKRDLFELRYAAGAVPLVTVLAARSITGLARTRRLLVIGTALCTAVLLLSLADQQLNGANPRLYDFKGALAPIAADPSPDTVLAYEPIYLADVLQYYAPDVRAEPLNALDPGRPGPIYVLVPDRLVDDPASSAAVGTRLAEIERTHRLVQRSHHPNVEVWEYR